MELMHHYQVSFKELLTEKFDFVIAASGYQKRCTFLAENMRYGDAEKLVITYDEQGKTEWRIENEKMFESFGFKSVKTLATDTDEIEKLMQRVCGGRICQNLNVLIDYSCMPRKWYAAIVNFLLKNDFQAQRINIYFSYTPKKVNILSQKSKLKAFEPIFGFQDKLSTDKPVTLVMGLNNNHTIIKELVEQLKPTDLAAFIPDFSYDSGYYDTIKSNNAGVLNSIATEKIFKYPAQRPDQIGSMLTSLCLDLRLNSNVVLVPNGPKTLSLASILLSVKYPDIKIFDLHAKDEKSDYDIGLPGGDPVVSKSVFAIDDEDDDY
ncbi:MAG: hypothetical protein JXB00_10375 [Bacteroidales bacterium]|nr:hypothetical protein [Bacteroidales bacterium]